MIEIGPYGSVDVQLHHIHNVVAQCLFQLQEPCTDL